MAYKIKNNIGISTYIIIFFVIPYNEKGGGDNELKTKKIPT